MAKKNKRSGIVYSTDPDYEYYEEEEFVEETPPPQQQHLRINLQRLKGNKKVTRIYNFVGQEDDIIDLGKDLKRQCGCGGSVKDREILLQGDLLDKVKKILGELGYKYKQVGG